MSADALIEQAGAVQLIGRAGSSAGYYPPAAAEYYLQLSNTGAWQVVRSSSGVLATLASGTVSAPGTGVWQHLALTFSGAAINGATVATVTDSTYSTGMVGFGTSGYQTDQFDNLSVTPVSGSAARTGPIVAGDNGAKCVDDNVGSSSPGAKVQIWDCGGSSSSQA